MKKNNKKFMSISCINNIKKRLFCIDTIQYLGISINIKSYQAKLPHYCKRFKSRTMRNSSDPSREPQGSADHHSWNAGLRNRCYGSCRVVDNVNMVIIIVMQNE